MHKEEEEIQIRFISYAHIPFKAEIEAENLQIDWGDGQYSQYRGKHFHPSHTYAHEGTFLIRMTGKKITYAHFARLSLSEIQFRYCNTLEYLDCSINELKELDLSQCPCLEELYCNSNNLEELHFSQHSHLSILNVSYNILKSIDLSGCCSLQTLYCSNNHLSHLELKTCTSIHHLDVSHNLFGKNDLDRLFLQLPERNINASLCYTENPGTGFENPSLFKVKKWSSHLLLFTIKNLPLRLPTTNNNTI